MRARSGRALTGYERRNHTEFDADIALAALRAAYRNGGRPYPPSRWWCPCGADFRTAANRDRHERGCAAPVSPCHAGMAM